MYLDQHFTVRNEKYKSLNELAFNLYKNEFFITLKGSLYKALSYYFKEIENRDNKENITKIKNIFKLMNDFDNISKPKIVRENNKIFWENDYNDYNDNKDNNIKEKHHFFDDWYDNYFIKDLDSSFEIKEKKTKNIPISEYIIEILSFKYQPHLLKKYFEDYYFTKILNKFNEIFINKNADKMSDYFYHMSRIELKQFYELNKQYKTCLHLIYYCMQHSIEKNGLKIFENKGIIIDKKM
jgi:hypothetical protein